MTTSTDTIPTINLNLTGDQQRPRSGSEPRRIVKAAPKKNNTATAAASTPPNYNPDSSASSIQGVVDSKNDAAAADDDENYSDKTDKKKQVRGASTNNMGSDHVPLPVAESPSVARQITQEHYQMSKEERFHSVTEKQKQRREILKKERRVNHTNNSNNADPSTSKKSAQPPVTANPFSRFLSIFSVEPAYPWHKRQYENANDDELQEPSEKRMKADPSHSEEEELAAAPEATAKTNMDDNSTVIDSNSTVIDSSIESTRFYAVAIAVAAIAVAAAWRFRSRR